MARIERPQTKICKYCKTEIPFDAKVCPNCRRKLKGGKLKWIILAVVILLLFGLFSGGGDDKGTKKVGTVSGGEASRESSTQDTAAQDTADADSAKEDASEPEAEVQTVYHVGDILQDGDLEIVYVSSGEYTEDNDYMQPREGYKYIYMQLAFENISDSSDEYISAYSFEAYADGYNADMYYGGEEDDFTSTLSAGRSVSGYLYFEVPEDAQEIEVEYETNFITEDKITFVYEGEADSGYVIEPNTEATEGALSVGEIFESKNLKISYLQCYTDDSGNPYIQPKDGYHYVTCEFEFENLSGSDQYVSAGEFDCFADGINCKMGYYRDDMLSATISDGRKAAGTVTFEVPDDATTVEVEYLDNIWTSDRIVFTVEE